MNEVIMYKDKRSYYFTQKLQCLRFVIFYG